ncbi:GTP-binding protein [Perkinsela sp. CCAP 1560/4]|nr:GTP-binding protein [Perkinsela sp. CCAP 1560/4]|eukprot:KNH06813.1 GTP-binding protein [Perkinsela sp. CCAP 1560/4]
MTIFLNFLNKGHLNRYWAAIPREKYFSARFCSFIPEKERIGIAPPMIPEGNRTGIARTVIDIDYFTPDKVRNFCIIAHIDHGKTTLSDAILRRTGVLRDTGSVPQCGYLDKLDVERERGITVKAQTCTMFLRFPGEDKTFMCNLIDTPGHADFSYEVKRSLSVCESAVLLVDVSQGIEAQTMSNFHLAMEQDVHILPVLSKLDRVLDKSDIGAAEDEMEESLGVFKSEILHTAAKKLLGVECLLEGVVQRCPSPTVNTETTCRATIFDAWPEKDFVRCFVRVVQGTLREGMGARLHYCATVCKVQQVGIMFPEPVRTPHLCAGHVGYALLPNDALDFSALIGETLLDASAPEQSISRAFRPSRPVVFAGFYPDCESDSTSLKRALAMLTTNDPSVTLESTRCAALGNGFQLGFLGMLHMKVFKERLASEFNEIVLVTPASIAYRAQLSNGEEIALDRSAWESHRGQITQFLQPITKATVVCHQNYEGSVRELLERRYHAIPVDQRTLRWNRTSLIYRLPLLAFSRGLFDQLKIVTSGYGSVEYEDPTYEPCDIVMLSIFVGDTEVEALSMPVERNDAHQVGRRFCQALHKHIPRSTLDVRLTARIGGKIVARETLAGLRKDVTHKCHAGDPTRKMKLLDNQKKARKLNNAKRKVGSIEIGQEAILAAMDTLRR